MKPSDRPLLSALKAEFDGLRGELGEMLALRRRLAWLELKADVATTRRMAIVLVLSAVSGLTALPLLAAVLAVALDGSLGLGQTGWLLVFGVVLMIVAIAAALFAWFRIRCRLTLLRQTREELREDLVWLSEWKSRRADQSADDQPPDP